MRIRSCCWSLKDGDIYLSMHVALQVHGAQMYSIIAQCIHGMVRVSQHTAPPYIRQFAFPW